MPITKCMKCGKFLPREMAAEGVCLKDKPSKGRGFKYALIALLTLGLGFLTGLMLIHVLVNLGIIR